MSQIVEIQYKELFDSEYANACRYALSYLQDSHMAEDAVQEVFIKLWEQKRDLIGQSGMRYYLIASVRNKCISILREQKGRQISYPETAPDAGHQQPEFALHHTERENEQQQHIREALGQLPPACKDVFLLIKLHNMTYKQAAQHLELSVKTIENQMGKAIKILREYSRKVAMIAYLFSFLKPII
jgi:RNA polymerase sigma-70 factor (ECF subfamily)